MSLINEALKRTRDASYQSASAPAAPATSYRVQSAAESSGPKGTLFATILVAVIALAGIIVLGLRITPGIKKLKNGFAQDETAMAPEPTQPAPLTRPRPMPATPAKVEAPAPEEPPSVPSVDPQATEDQLVSRVMEKIKAEQTPAPAPPERPKLVLQGITYAAAGSEAMINGVSLREGEDIEGARVITIERRFVRLDFGGREIVLRMQ